MLVFHMFCVRLCSCLCNEFVQNGRSTQEPPDAPYYSTRSVTSHELIIEGYYLKPRMMVGCGRSQCTFKIMHLLHYIYI